MSNRLTLSLLIILYSYKSLPSLFINIIRGTIDSCIRGIGGLGLVGLGSTSRISLLLILDILHKFIKLNLLYLLLEVKVLIMLKH